MATLSRLLPIKFLSDTCNGAHTSSFFSQERTFAGIGAVTVDGPLDLLDVNFQVSSRGPEGSTIGRGMWRALCEICAQGARDGVGYIAV